ncbi:hypothetical protein like AT1G53440 [Hibiscus trionum]|uniref:non-specific serine/threonine protein kinase n=1 Tax=Hibiscus trionum TaxID=183268 RepID=A0A9W7II41_HIBTR|nr:hypothetical protein like AT1G53440 [Hibiscus trionum]
MLRKAPSPLPIILPKILKTLKLKIRSSSQTTVSFDAGPCTAAPATRSLTAIVSVVHLDSKPPAVGDTRPPTQAPTTAAHNLLYFRTILSFGNLKNFNDFRIDGSSMSGKILDFIGNWTKLTRLDMQGTSMEGPIPSTISKKITDLSGRSSAISNLKGMEDMKELVLRNCLLTGSILSYIGEMTSLKTLQIPQTLQGLAKIDYLFLTNNSLTRPVPGWNNFTSSSQTSCQQARVNLVCSSSSSADSYSVTWCLRKDLPCPRKLTHHSLFINCGGEHMEVDGNDYYEDLSTIGPWNFFNSANKWAYSSTWVYLGNVGAHYTARAHMLCLVQPSTIQHVLLRGNYNVTLHFAEIIYSDSKTFESLGRRLFDVSIQGKVVLEDFNIMEEAGGVGKGIFKEFNVDVKGSTLEINL